MMKQEPKLQFILSSCREGNKSAQRMLYELYFSYGMSICLRYAHDREEAREMLNDGFFKVFTRIDQYDEEQAFKPWFRGVLVNAAIDYLRKYKRLNEPLDADRIPQPGNLHNNALSNLEFEELVGYVQQLPTAYRTVFNLYVVEGHTHQEIAEKLGISVGSSKSNLARAKKKLQLILADRYSERNEWA